jgi:hypothetical protein
MRVLVLPVRILVPALIGGSVASLLATDSTSTGLGVAREDVQKVLEAPPFGVVFETVTPVNGESRVMGKKESADGSGIAIVELMGPPANLTRVDCNVANTKTSTAGAITNAAIMLAVIKTSLPAWNDGAKWLNSALVKVGKTGEVKTTFRQAQIRLKYLKSLSLVTLSISSSSASASPNPD